MGKQGSDHERIQFALKTERDGHDFYDTVVKQADHKLARAAFELLAKEELRHVSMIEALEKELHGEASASETKSPGLKALELGVRTIYESASDEISGAEFDTTGAYEKAIELEKRITALYHGYSKDCDSAAARRLFAVLGREEQNHLTLLEDTLGYLAKPGEWFIDRDGVMLDGG